ISALHAAMAQQLRAPTTARFTTTPTIARFTAAPAPAAPAPASRDSQNTESGLPAH
ncbi:MAG: hypothetical protein QOG76_1680, partial [Pseudonocardiales bacterium]|nr:hypothetical protein [Pseudonocardiales bacterium]